MRVELRHRHFERVAVDEAYEAQLLGRRNELARRGDACRPCAHHAQQTFVMLGLARLGADDRLIGEDEPVLVERRHDFVGDAHQAQPRHLALRRFGIDHEAVAARAVARSSASSARSIASWLDGRARRQPHCADGHGRRYRAAARCRSLRRAPRRADVRPRAHFALAAIRPG